MDYCGCDHAVRQFIRFTRIQQNKLLGFFKLKFRYVIDSCARRPAFYCGQANLTECVHLRIDQGFQRVAAKAENRTGRG
jgi:hypothetical protein